MEKDDIKFFDLNRWLFGSTPPSFLLEVFLRTTLIYLFLLMIVRLMGKRMTGQITLSELSVVITPGAIVSPVMQLPDKGIIYGIITLSTALLFHKTLTFLSLKSRKIERLTQGIICLLIKDGVIQLDMLKQLRISKPQLFALLREQNALNLGNIERAYIESCGILSIFKYDEPKTGLSTMPDTDKEAFTIQKVLEDQQVKCCENCGHVQNTNHNDVCEICKQTCWLKAYLTESI